MNTSDSINLAIAISTGLSVLISLAVALVTYKTVLANRAAVDVMRAQLEATTRPYIVVAAVVRPMSTFFQLKITNFGGSSAKNLRLSLDRDFYFNADESRERNLRTYSAFNQPIAEFAPRAELLFHLGVGHNILNSTASPTLFSVLARYEYSGKEVAEETIVDLRPFQNSGMPIDPIAEPLEKIARELEAVRSLLLRQR